MTATEDLAASQDALPDDLPESTLGAETDPSDARKGRLSVGWVKSHLGLIGLLLVPLALFGIPELFGRVFLDGDNFLQNFPLRVLVGRDLQHGVFPLWNPFLFSGTPLLAGFNAGAAYPATWLTAILPVFTAWTFNLVLAYDLALAGTYLFLRRQSISTTGALFGAAAFAFAGYMTSQIVHIDLIEGAAWMPWSVLAVHGITSGPSSRRAIRGWVALLAVSLGLSVLTGSAEAIIDSSVLVGIYAVGRLVTMDYLHRGRLRALARTVGALVLGAVGGGALGAVQWLPGLQFLSQSQRSGANYSFFTSGSMPLRLMALIASPFIEGTNQGNAIGYVGPLNFEEASCYVGVLALIAACSLVVKRFRTRPEARQWWIWYVIAGVGLLSAFGGQTPFGHVLFVVPILNSERLLNRNLLLVDFALAVLLGWWIHLLFDRSNDAPSPEAPSPPTTVRPPGRTGRRAEVVATCLPLAIIVGLCLALWFDAPGLERVIGIQPPATPSSRPEVAVLVTIGALIAAAATGVVLLERRLTVTWLRRLLAVILAVDLAFFNYYVIRPPTTEAKAQATGTMASSLRAETGDGRFIIYDPDQFETTQLYELGQTDLNTFASFPSGQGYTALTGGDYFDATGAHFQEDLNPATLAGATWDNLNVTVLLSLPGYFLTPLGTGTDYSSSSRRVQFPASINSYNSAPTPVAKTYTLSGGRPHTWYFGSVLGLDAAAVPVLGGEAGNLRAGLVSPTGGVDWLPPSEVLDAPSAAGHETLRIHLAQRVSAAGVVVEARSPGTVTLGTPTATTAETGKVALNGRMQYGVTPPHWVFTGTLGSFGVFHNTRPRGWAWVGRAGVAGSGAGTVAATPPSDNGDQQITVRTTSPAVLTRSESWSTGWKATLQPVASSPGHPTVGAARDVPVFQTGVEQAVHLPGPGEYLVTFRYRPATAEVGLVVSGVAGVTLLLWGVVEIWYRRRRVRAGPSSRAESELSPV